MAYAAGLDNASPSYIDSLRSGRLIAHQAEGRNRTAEQPCEQKSDTGVRSALKIRFGRGVGGVSEHCALLTTEGTGQRLCTVGGGGGAGHRDRLNDCLHGLVHDRRRVAGPIDAFLLAM